MIDEFTSGMDFEAFRSDLWPLRLSNANCRSSEAAIRLADDAESGFAPDCHGVISDGIGNQLRRAHERIDLNSIWTTVKDDLPTLKAGIENALRR